MADQDVPTITLDEVEILADGESDVKQEQVEEQQTTPEESSPEENKEAEVAKPKEETESEPAEPSQDDTEAESADETEPEEQPRGKAEERKDQLNSEIRDLVAQKNAIQAQVEQLNAQVYAPQSIEQLMAENPELSQADARVAALEQKIELNEYNSRVADAQLTIGRESEKVLTEFPIFNPESPQYNQALASQAAELLQANLVTDQNTGQVIGSNVSPYSLYKTIYDATQANVADSKIAGQRAAEKMLASTDAPSSTPPQEKKEDPFLTGLRVGLK